jgi:cell division septal protein FtsQ
MQRFVAVYQSELAPRLAEVERVDLRYESGVAVKFNEPPAVVETDNESKT